MNFQNDALRPLFDWLSASACVKINLRLVIDLVWKSLKRNLWKMKISETEVDYDGLHAFLEIIIWCVALMVCACTVTGNFWIICHTLEIFVKGSSNKKSFHFGPMNFYFAKMGPLRRSSWYASLPWAKNFVQRQAWNH